jgi:hypothetical protein
MDFCAYGKSWHLSGLSDGLFSNQKSQCGNILESIGTKKVGMCYDHLEYIMAIWYKLCPFSIVCSHLVYFSQFGMFGPRKIWQPWHLCVKFGAGATVA